jgi:Tol biopolymer transport system component
MKKVSWMYIVSILLAAAVAAAQELEERAALYALALDPAGLFEARGDIGPVRTPGTFAYDPERQVYRMSGSGTNMWGAADEFFFAWRRMRGDFILSANASFPTEGGDPHRKIGWMIRPGLEPGSAYVDAALHGDGLTSLQYRAIAGGETLQVESAVTAPGFVQLERRGGRYVMSVARDGEELVHTEFDGIDLPDEVYVGLFVCAHNADAVEAAEFSNVRITVPAPADFRPYQDYFPSRLEVMEVDTGHRRVLYTAPDAMQAPNWTPDGRALVFNRNGRLYRFELETGAVDEIDTGFATRNNNDHAISFDGKMLAISHHSDEHDGESIVYTVPFEGGEPKLVTTKGPSYLHGWSLDGQWLVYTGGREGNYDIYKMRASGEGEEVRLTEHAALDDGAEFAPDGKHIWFNSARSGRMQLWRMDADGGNPMRETDDAFNNWFPHLSPDGRKLIYLAYGPEVAADDHPWYRQVTLKVRPVAGGEARVIARLYGGQGTINVPSWSPDGRYVAFVSN